MLRIKLAVRGICFTDKKRRFVKIFFDKSPDVRQKQTAFALFCLKSCMYSYFKELHIFWFISRIFFSFTLISFLS